MDLTQLEGYDAALKAVRANTSPRAFWLATLDSYVDGTQYNGRPDWFTANVPLWERAPCIVYPIVQSAIDSNTDLVLGDGRFPEITTQPDEGDADFDKESLNEDDAGHIDRFIVEIGKQVRLRSCLREVFTAAQGCGSGVEIFGVRAGKLFLDTTKARWCTPSFGLDGKIVALDISYPYIEQYQDRAGKWAVRPKLYRRVIDSIADTTFLPADARSDGVTPVWVADPLQTFRHGFGFCPAHWYPFMRGCSVINDIDGVALHAHLLDEVRALDFALSQRHRAALYAGDPQWTEIGVELGSNPSSKGVVQGMPATAKGGAPSASNPITSHYADPPTRKSGRKKSPGDVWQYESPDTKVDLHCLPGDALEALSKHAADLRLKIAESMAVVFMDQEHIKLGSSMSGKALEALKARQLDRCDQYRSDVEDHLLVPTVEMLLRVVKGTADRGATLRLRGLTKALPIMKTWDVAEAVAAIVAP